ncbi:MAG: zinc ribbon domain-containing protein [Melioribacteraceae bacterium]|nr:zinc ribbon domain-containing protein [Melioribacteraceae bacterium]
MGLVILINEYKICPHCSYFSHISEQDKYCSLCGSELLVKCTDCGHPYDNPYAKYCKHCGRLIKNVHDKENQKIHF